MLEKKHLVIIGHGSQSQTWNKAVFSFCDEMKNHLTCSGPFSDISLCFLEHGKPSIPDHLHVVCDTTHDDILAIPLFLTVTQHVQHDIPKEIEKMAAYRCCVDGKRVYEHNGRAITLAPPPASYELLAENIVNRFIRYEINSKVGILIVYYGTKRFMPAWEELAENVNEHVSLFLPGLLTGYVYCGEAADFSPAPLVKRMKEMHPCVEQIVLIPALLSVGAIQTSVIPKAIEQSGLQSKIFYKNDAVLPDPFLVKKIYVYASSIKKHLS
jgi:sirohydrochlorin ferrochelatase